MYRITIFSILYFLILNTYSQNNYTETALGINLEMIYVKGSSFTMGCTYEQKNDCKENEKPVHEVSLSDFYIGKFPVTNKQFKAIMGMTTSQIKGCIDCPVESVNWFEAQNFLKKLNDITGKNYRLPTEAEWEFAARGGKKSNNYKYAGSNNLLLVGWFQKDKEPSIQPVGLKKPNELGIYDMSGGVWEWCYDWYGDYTKEPKINPQRTEPGRFKVIRGGSWTVTENNCRVSSRHRYFPNIKTYDLGFRIVKDVE